LGSSLAFTLKEDPVRCAKVCNKSWVILTNINHFLWVCWLFAKDQSSFYPSLGNLTNHVAIMNAPIFQRKHERGTHKTFYNFVYMGLFVMTCIILVFGTFLSASTLGDSGYDIRHEATTPQPSTSTPFSTSKLLSLDWFLIKSSKPS
jgi:hypothetical protein